MTGPGNSLVITSTMPSRERIRANGNILLELNNVFESHDAKFCFSRFSLEELDEFALSAIADATSHKLMSGMATLGYGAVFNEEKARMTSHGQWTEHFNKRFSHLMSLRTAQRAMRWARRFPELIISIRREWYSQHNCEPSKEELEIEISKYLSIRDLPCDSRTDKPSSNTDAVKDCVMDAVHTLFPTNDYSTIATADGPTGEFTLALGHLANRHQLQQLVAYLVDAFNTRSAIEIVLVLRDDGAISRFEQLDAQPRVLLRTKKRSYIATILAPTERHADFLHAFKPLGGPAYTVVDTLRARRKPTRNQSLTIPADNSPRK